MQSIVFKSPVLKPQWTTIQMAALHEHFHFPSAMNGEKVSMLLTYYKCLFSTLRFIMIWCAVWTVGLDRNVRWVGSKPVRGLWDSLLDYLTKHLTCLSSDGYLLMNRWWEETNTIMVYWAPAGCLYCCKYQCVWTTVCWFGHSKVTFLTMRTNTLVTYCTFSLLASMRWKDWHTSHIRLLNIKLEQRDS